MYFRTYNTGQALSGPPAGGWTDISAPATVSSFSLDKYLVTVGRFRQFVAAWNQGTGWLPAAGSGKHSHLPGGGLVIKTGIYETGWDATDDNNTTDINPTNAILGSCAASTWTNSASTQENLPIDCVNWFEAYAFCIWDGGFLPSEAEWGYAAAGGGGTNGQREYPWGSTAPGTTNQYAIYDSYYTGNSLKIAPVGTGSLGAGAWGQLDWGEVNEWVLDFSSTYPLPCTDCVNLTAGTDRVVRGGEFGASAAGLLPPSRSSLYPNQRGATVGTTIVTPAGFRCARTP
jgi:formylglycine-generating enzyme required for sulfatase activity